MVLYTRGAAGFTDLKSANGIEYASYKEAAQALGVLEDDREVERCLLEAAQISHPTAVRKLLAFLLQAGEVADAPRIVELNMQYLAEDFLYQARQVKP